MSLDACQLRLCNETQLKGCEALLKTICYLAQLLLRLDQRQQSPRLGYFWLYRDPEDDDNSIWYEQVKCIVTNCVIGAVA